MRRKFLNCLTSYPSANAANAGNTTQTSLTMPAIISFLQPVSCTEDSATVTHHVLSCECSNFAIVCSCPFKTCSLRVTSSYLDCFHEVLVVPRIYLSWPADVRCLCKRLLHFWYQWAVRPGFETAQAFHGVASKRSISDMAELRCRPACRFKSTWSSE